MHLGGPSGRFEPVGTEERERDAFDTETDARGVRDRAVGRLDPERQAEVVAVAVGRHDRGGPVVVRDRRDAFLKYNQYLPNRSSVRFDYRFYTDDWGVLSHSIEANV